jgi:hypothetical protein
MIHTDIKKLGRFERVGHRITGDRRGQSNSRGAGWKYVHVCVDDHSRIAFTGIYSDEKAVSAIAFHDACKALGLRHIRTRPYTPKTNGKAERVIKTALNEWAYAHIYQTSDQRAAHLPEWTERRQPVEAPELMHSRPQWRFVIGGQQHHPAHGIGHPQGQHFRHEGADLARREVDHGHDHAACQVFQAVELGDLGRGLLDPDLGAKIDPQLVGGLARLGERLGVDHPTGADIDFHEIVETDGLGAYGLGHGLSPSLGMGQIPVWGPEKQEGRLPGGGRRPSQGTLTLV